MRAAGKLKILYVEDDPDTARLIGGRLEQSEFAVEVCGDGEAGIAALAAERYDVLVLDYDLPGIDGLEVLRRLAGRFDVPPVVMLTGAGDERVAMEAIRLGVYDYLTKDVEGDYFRYLPAIVTRVLRQRVAWEERGRSDQLAKVALGAIGDAVIATDRDGRITLVNEVAEQLTGWGCEEAYGRPLQEIVRVYTARGDVELPLPLRAVLQDGVRIPAHNNCRLQRRDGRMAPIENSLVPIHAENGAVEGAVLVFKDVTETHRHREYLELLEKVVHSTGDAVVITDAGARIIEVNQAFCDITGYRRDEVLGQNPRIMKSDRHDPEFYRRMWAVLLADGVWQGEIWDRKKNGELFAKWLTINTMRDEVGRISHFASIFSDISALKRTEGELQQQAHHDPLTGLPNRALFHDRLTQQMAHAARTGTLVAVLFLDLDRFKDINDRYGHRAGDELLIEVGRRLCRCVRDEDTVARLGGDEFTVVLGGVATPQVAAKVAEKILEVFTQPFAVGTRILTVTPSVGIALYPLAGTSVEALLGAADRAMYQVKQEGCNGFRFYRDDLNAEALRHLTLEQDLKRALELGELEIHYQPQVDLRERRCVGVEALLRWRHPGRGLLLPKAFLPLAEESGLIVPIGAWVLDEACRQCRLWHDQGLTELRVAVNLSPRQVADPGLMEAVASALTRYALEPASLELEVTESTLMRSPEVTLAALIQLKELGVRVAVDDFGTGYLSLNLLHGLPVDTLKIDGSFVRNVIANRADATLSELIINVARVLKVAVVAEGVETMAQLEFLRARECCDVQGYYFGEPAPAAELDELLRAPCRTAAGNSRPT